jgi:hypothetical protein
MHEREIPLNGMLEGKYRVPTIFPKFHQILSIYFWKKTKCSKKTQNEQKPQKVLQQKAKTPTIIPVMPKIRILHANIEGA